MVDNPYEPDRPIPHIHIRVGGRGCGRTAETAARIAEAQRGHYTRIPRDAYDDHHAQIAREAKR